MVVKIIAPTDRIISSRMIDFFNKKYQTRFQKNRTNYLQFFASVEFGVPSKNCRNYGICRLNVIGQGVQSVKPKGRCNSPSYQGHITYYDEQQLEMSFQKLAIKEGCRNKYFATNFFRVDEDFSTFLLIEQGCQKVSLTIKKGRYPIVKKQDSYVIMFFK